MHLDCFPINAEINMGVHISLWYPVFMSFEYIPRCGITVLYSSSIFNCLRNLPIVFHSGWTNWHAHQQCIRFPFIHILTNTCYLLFYWDSHSNRYEVISHCGFDLHSLSHWWCWISFPEPVGQLAVFFGKNVYWVPLFVSLLMGCKSSLYVLDINPYLIYGLLKLLSFCSLPFIYLFIYLLCRSFHVSLITFVDFCFCCLWPYPKNHW